MKRTKKSPRDFTRYGVQYAYVLDSIEPDEVELHSDKERINYIMEQFEGYDYPNNRLRIPNDIDRIADWLQGLPSGFHIAFMNYDIIQLGKSWGFCKDERAEERFIDNWWRVIATHILKLHRILNENS